MSEVFYVYEHIRNDTNQIFYVGKGKAGKGRSDSMQNRNRYWHNIVNKAGFSVRKIAEDLTEPLAFQKEIERIKELRELGIKLCNLTDGGEGISGHKHSAKTLVKISEALSGENNPWYNKKHSEDTLAKMSETNGGENNPMYNKKQSEDTRARMSEAKSGENHPNFGKSPSAETREKSRASHLALPKVTCPYCMKEGNGSNMKRWHFDNCQMNPSALPHPPVTEETRVKLSKAKSGENNPMYNKKHTDETLAKLSASLLALPKVTCPYCMKEGDFLNMKRWHFDNCKKRDKSESY